MNVKFLCFGFFVHLVFFYSIFDIYFTSPLSHGMRSHGNSFAPPAKRLVLISADGLRADKLYEHHSGESYTPFLRHIIQNIGTYGISHTRVPTESRPGHVAFIAGFYEDVSAITKGWKENPVEFDSIFNESRNTWSWGSPDILPMFSKGATGNHVFTQMYPGNNEDFAGKDLTMLDSWVFDNVKSFFENTTTEKSLMLQKDRLVFFLHLLGLDTTGHVHKPHSQEYIKNLRVVDEGVKRMVDVFDEYFNHDGLTTFIFTSDHGMTDWGSHGAGDPSETQTPFIAWGAGVNRPIPTNGIDVDVMGKNWGLENVTRIDIDQADICPLMATLIGIPIPHQSVGVIPAHILNTSLAFKAQSLYTNVLQVYEQYKIKEDEKEKTVFSILFTPYQSSSRLKEDLILIEDFLRYERHEVAINMSIPLISLILGGVQYYHQYDVRFLGISVALSFTGWMMLMAVVLLEEHTNMLQSPMVIHRACQGVLGLKFVGLIVPVVIIIFLAAQSKPATYYIYCLLPVLIYYAVLQRCHVLWSTWSYLRLNKLLSKVFFYVPLAVIGLEVVIFSFTHRQMISVGLIAMAIWKLFDRSENAISDLIFTLSCLLASFFPLLPTVGLATNYVLVYFAAVLGFSIYLLFALSIFKHSKNLKWDNFDWWFLLIQALLVVISSLILWWFVEERKSSSSSSSSSSLQSLTSSSSLSLYLHSISWLILGSSFFLPLATSTKIIPRILSIMLAFFSPYLLLSISHESLFYVTLCVLMISWTQLETGSTIQKLLDIEFKKHKFVKRKLKLSDIRCSYFFIFFLLASFFGTGNVASINSFDPTTVLCFITVFNPFVMGSLMLYKIVILFLIVSTCFYAIQVCLNVPRNSISLLVLIISDFMALHFFFMVRNQGSWLEIGTTISHYVIVMALILFLFILLSICKLLTETSIWSLNKKRTD